jgi:hypothetical protein
MITLTQAQLPMAVMGTIDVKGAIVRVVDVDWSPDDVRRELMKKGCYHIASIQGKIDLGEAVPAPKDRQMDDAQFVDRFAEKKGYAGDLPKARTAIVRMLNGAVS